MSFERDTPAAASFSGNNENASRTSIFRDTLPSRPNRPKPRAYGTAKYGVGIYSPSDVTRYSWTRAASGLAALALALLLGSPAAAASNPYCEAADAQTTVYSFCKPAVDVEGSNFWGLKANYNYEMFESALSGIATSTGSINATVATLGQSTAALSASTVTLAAEVARLHLATTTVAVDTTTLGAQVTQLDVSTRALAAGVATTYVHINGDTMTGALTVNGAAGIQTPYGMRAGSGTFTEGVTASSGTFTATGNNQFSIKSSSGVRIETGNLSFGTGGFIQWPDGTVSTTAAGGGGGGGGDVFLANSNSFVTAGTNQTFGSSVTFSGLVQTGPTSYSNVTATDTITGRRENDWNTVAVASFTAAAEVRFYGLVSTAPYRLTCYLTKNTAGNLYARYNDDTGSNYITGGLNDVPSVGVGDDGLTAATDHISFNGPDGVNGNLRDGGGGRLRWEWATVDQQTKRAVGESSLVGNNAAGTVINGVTIGNMTFGHHSTFYLGSSAISNVKIYNSAGTFSGRCLLERFVSMLFQ